MKQEKDNIWWTWENFECFNPFTGRKILFVKWRNNWPTSEFIKKFLRKLKSTFLHFHYKGKILLKCFWCDFSIWKKKLDDNAVWQPSLEGFPTASHLIEWFHEIQNHIFSYNRIHFVSLLMYFRISGTSRFFSSYSFEYIFYFAKKNSKIVFSSKIFTSN